MEIKNQTSLKINKKSFSQVAKKVLSGENRRTEILSLAFINKAEMKKLNSKFRKKNKPTDVLSFNLDEKEYLGEIVICPEIVENNSEKFGVSFKEELLKVFVHGILHLCGYDHEKSIKDAQKMEAKQEEYLSKIK